ncbi:secreted frizzled-related protein 3-like [Patiria miniata]|uniref:Secreted frizzled-related protein 3 n=1 Tax=Patiria miniata TaxID=46514 RepID=A0A913ZM13_PATMI|nr:secreted frizzled-related protein 3-like [Patiria miniata]WJJ61101.1 Sfrp3/4 [Patiria miniata]
MASVGLGLVVLLIALVGHCSTVAEAAGCEAIQLPMCSGMKYNMTQMPNLLHHSAQENARLSIEQFQDLVNTNCSELLLFFLCTMYAPICTKSLEFEVESIPPCKGVCVEARQRCEPTMLKYNVTWPEYLSCQHLPEYTRGVCLTPEAIVDTMPDEDEDNGSDVITEPAIIQPPKPKRKGSCKRCDSIRINQGAFMEKAYEYVVRATVTSFVTVGENLMYTTIIVRDVLKFTDINIPIGEVHLVTEGPCVCPKVSAGVDYVIMCYQDLENGRLRLTEECVAQEWEEDNWPRLVKKWDKKLRKAKRREEKEKEAPPTGSNSRRRRRQRPEPTEAPSRDRRNRGRTRADLLDDVETESVSDSML